MSTATPTGVQSLTSVRAAVLALACCASVTLVVNVLVNVPQHDDLLAIDAFVAGVDAALAAVVFSLVGWAQKSPSRSRGLAVAVIALSLLALPAYWLVVHPVLGIAALQLADRLPDNPPLARASRVCGWFCLAIGAAFAVGAVVHYFVA